MGKSPEARLRPVTVKQDVVVTMSDIRHRSPCSMLTCVLQKGPGTLRLSRRETFIVGRGLASLE